MQVFNTFFFEKDDNGLEMREKNFILVVKRAGEEVGKGR